MKTPLVMQEMRVRSLGQEDPLEKEIATHSSVLGHLIKYVQFDYILNNLRVLNSDSRYPPGEENAWKIPWTEEPYGYSAWDHKCPTQLSN